MHKATQIYKDSHKDYYKNVEGPIGGSERFDWVAATFFSGVRGKRILEIGCGEGSLLKALAGENQVQGVDISETGVEKTRQKGIPCELADASNEAMPFADGTFDVAITLETIEHVENPHRMLWEIRRVLKEGGTLLISIPGEKVYHPFIYPGLFTRKNFREFLEANGFRVRDVRGWGQAPMLAHWSKRVEKSGGAALKELAGFLFYVGRKRNMLMRKKLKWTPLSRAYTMNFVCECLPKRVSRIEEVAAETTPKG